MAFEIIDFHTHPFGDERSNICAYKPSRMEDTVSYLKGLGISRICGSVIYPAQPDQTHWEAIQESNRIALELAKAYSGFYIPGFHVHPDYVQQSCDEIEKMHRLGLKLIGELVPYYHGWQDYSCKAFDAILDTAAQFNMVVNFHSLDPDQMDTMVRRHPDVTLVAAHPGEASLFARHLKRMEMSENYYLDLSGTGLFRHRMLRHGIDTCGAHRFLFGTDYPVCNPSMFLGGVFLDSLLTDWEKQLILSGNTKRLLDLD